MAKKTISHNELFVLVLDELLIQLGDTFPAIDLMKAAERLTLLIDADFNFHAVQKSPTYANYYSHDLDWAFSTGLWQIVCREERADLLGDQRLTADQHAMDVLKRYLESW
ncbi:hypothetical protein [Sphingorhabdus sp.]|uniref:hypothetical protein n=1 Tax=Sphingorhabdus sp. TaxID=1902408 RepID=UPI0037CC7C3B